MAFVGNCHPERSEGSHAASTSVPMEMAMRSFATLQRGGYPARDDGGNTMLIAQISDMHVKAEGKLLFRRIDTAGFLERAVAHVNALDPRPDIVLATGDLVDGGKPEEYAHLRRMLAPLAMPLYMIPGNHDARDALREAFPEHAYLPPTGFLQYTIENLPVRL